MKIYNILLKLVIGLSILFFLIYKVGIKSIYENILKINMMYIPLALIVAFIVNLLGSWKLLLFLKSVNIRIPFLKVYHYYFLSFCFSMFIPGRLGELILIYFLKKENVELGIGSAVVVLDKLIGFIAILIFSIVGVFLFFDFNNSIKIILTLIVFFGAGIYFIFSDFGRNIIKKRVLRKFESRFHGFSKTLFYLIKHDKIRLLNNFLISLVKWSVNSLFLFLLFHALGQKISLLSITLINSIIVLFSFVPISINGLGIKESVGVFLFKLVGVPFLVTSSVLVISLIISYTIALVYLILFLDMKSLSLNMKKLFD